ncbi:hypothetical protein U1Q18_027130 [Sarracenia purpurea var. burkii]
MPKAEKNLPKDALSTGIKTGGERKIREREQQRRPFLAAISGDTERRRIVASEVPWCCAVLFLLVLGALFRRVPCVVKSFLGVWLLWLVMLLF